MLFYSHINETREKEDEEVQFKMVVCDRQDVR
jgi:hypothetical protein